MTSMISLHHMTGDDEIKMFHYRVPLYAYPYRKLKQLFKNRTLAELSPECQNRTYFSTSFQLTDELWVRLKLKTGLKSAFIEIDLLNANGVVVGGTSSQRPRIDEVWQLRKCCWEDEPELRYYIFSFYSVSLKSDSVPYDYDNELKHLEPFLRSERVGSLVQANVREKLFTASPCYLSRYCDLGSRLNELLQPSKSEPSDLHLVRNVSILTQIYEAEVERKKDIPLPALSIPFDAPIEEKLRKLLTTNTFKRASIMRQNKMIAKLLQSFAVQLESATGDDEINVRSANMTTIETLLLTRRAERNKPLHSTLETTPSLTYSFETVLDSLYDLLKEMTRREALDELVNLLLSRWLLRFAEDHGLKQDEKGHYLFAEADFVRLEEMLVKPFC